MHADTHAICSNQSKRTHMQEHRQMLISRAWQRCVRAYGCALEQRLSLQEGWRRRFRDGKPRVYSHGGSHTYRKDCINAHRCTNAYTNSSTRTQTQAHAYVHRILGMDGQSVQTHSCAKCWFENFQDVLYVCMHICSRYFRIYYKYFLYFTTWNECEKMQGIEHNPFWKWQHGPYHTSTAKSWTSTLRINGNMVQIILVLQNPGPLPYE